MTTPTGDSIELPPPPPLQPNRAVLLKNAICQNFLKYSGHVFYWTFKIAIFFLSITFEIVSHPTVWFLLKALFNAALEAFIYMVLCACSFMISIITNLDAYYSKGKKELWRMQDGYGQREVKRDGLEIQNYTVKKFIETPDFDMAEM